MFSGLPALSQEMSISYHLDVDFISPVEEDGEQHITGNIVNFFFSRGVTLQAQCAVSYQGEYTRSLHDSCGRAILLEATSRSRTKEVLSE